MKSIYSSLVGVVVLVVFAAVANAGHDRPPWDHAQNNPGRFSVLSQFNNKAVLDKETGRVWEQSPSTSAGNWFNALSHCYQLEVGGRKGWRLPTIEELASLVDTSQSSPALPAGHPFSNVQSSDYWSATTFATSSSFALGVDFFDGDVGFDDKSDSFFVWCVRGGQGIDGVQ